jgi:hypothetical protein
MPLAALSVYTTTMTSLVPICYVAIRLKQKLSLHDVPLIGTWVKPRGDLPGAIEDFAELADSKPQDSTLIVPARYFQKNLAGLRIIAIFVFAVGLLSHGEVCRAMRSSPACRVEHAGRVR